MPRSEEAVPAAAATAADKAAPDALASTPDAQAPASIVDAPVPAPAVAYAPAPAPAVASVPAPAPVPAVAYAPAPAPAVANTAALVPTAAPAPAWRTDLLVEYFAGGSVVRYEHLEDAANNSFRLLRRLRPGEANLSFAQFVGPSNWDFAARVPDEETELFDLGTDPYQLDNAVAKATPALRADLEATLERLFRCRGSSCN